MTNKNKSAIGLGCMGMSGAYGATDDDESVATIQAAIDAGVAVVDTGDFYGMGHNELLVGRALKGRRDQAVLSVKFGALRGPDNAMLGLDMRPAAVKTWCAYSLQRLGVDVIDIYRPCRLDPNVPIEDTIGAVADLVKAGYVRHIGLSEVGADTVRRAAKVHPIVDVQIEYSIASRRPEQNLFPALRELGIGATLYSVFSRGLLTGSTPGGAGDFRAHLPRFSGDNRNKNAGVADAVARFAAARNISAGQALIGWVLAKAPGFTPVIGAKNRKQLTDALAAKPLSAADADELSSLVPSVAGERYGADQMRHLDSER
jgi:aryl-alcohol dehydrogenase-like predicted oxidoreductase